MSDLIINREASGAYNNVIETGLRLAALPESEGGWLEYFSESDLGDLRLENEVQRAHTAIMLENAKVQIARQCRGGKRMANGNMRIDEATRSALVGGFSDYLFPIIRAAFPTNPINELISVQPTNRKIATVVYWNYMIGSNKGSYAAGQRIFDANTGRTDTGKHYSDEVVENEPTTVALTNSNATAMGTLAYNDGGGVRPNTVQITLTTSGGTATFYDNGNGGIISPGIALAGTSSINYQNGQYTIILSSLTFSSAAGLATYQWDSEGSLNLPQMDVQITTATAEAEQRAMILNYSIQALQDVMAEFGVSLEPDLLQACTEEINYEIARQIISTLWATAPISSTFSLTNPQYISQQQYFGDFIYYLNRASNSIWERTQKAYANWIVVDSGAATLVESLPNNMFQAAPQPPSVQGLHYIGTLNNRWRVYKDLLLKNEVGASSYGNLLLGFKGRNFFEAGFVYAPYNLFFSTDSIPTPGFTVNKGIATRYATKLVNPNMYARISLSA